ncbi:hypothetical protein PFICI_05946 [Pestalotiopsis fici W106-1]|uniref:Uncharacterized protein n=1 Tax=Pestalotiopsis fici (strain W106-1 / CGMCC3.15140) TaxID=1229662 RepID=W3XDE0_PESFW|nr:uncharacterized protein PFICI_05946 [Pestalotiopsis fici W106-1]ETS84070.1 hypothetical protein PFICI_05946 [Pestalotiopsis fici W106-1]
MARLQTRKRKRADEPLPEDVSSEKARLNFPPDFYDTLSKLWLTDRALREHDQRTDARLFPKSGSPQSSIVSFNQATARGDLKLARFARTGGPDLSDLRGCQPLSDEMASRSSSISSKRTQSTRPTTVSSTSRRSSAYDANFEQHLIDHDIYPPFYCLPNGQRTPKPTNIEEIRQALKTPRASLSPSVVPESAFEDFQIKNTTKSEGTIMRVVVPILAGDVDIPNEGHLPFLNLASITGNTTANPIPDFFDGAQPGKVEKVVREELGTIIIPTKHANAPVAPNFFLEAKGPGGTGDVAQRQAVLNGAHGARIMHALQNYLVPEPGFDGNAYAFTSTLVDGTLKLYAHHILAPNPLQERPQYYTTQIKAYATTGDDEVWREGSAAFRNIRILAQKYRDKFIEAANAKARSQVIGTTDAGFIEVIPSQRDYSSSPADFFECRLFADPDESGSQTEETETQETNLGLGILKHSFEDDPDGNDDAGDSQSFATSFASNIPLPSVQTPPSRPAKFTRSPPSPSASRQYKRRGRE